MLIKTKADLLKAIEHMRADALIAMNVEIAEPDYSYDWREINVVNVNGKNPDKPQLIKFEPGRQVGC